MVPKGSHERSVSAVASDVDRLLCPKSLSELASLERQINTKLLSNEPIDIEYWEQLLRSITVYKSKAELDSVYKSVVQGRLRDFQAEQCAEAELSKSKLSLVLADHGAFAKGSNTAMNPSIKYTHSLDPEPQLRLQAKDKALDVVTTEDFIDQIVSATNY